MPRTRTLPLANYDDTTRPSDHWAGIILAVLVLVLIVSLFNMLGCAADGPNRDPNDPRPTLSEGLAATGSAIVAAAPALPVPWNVVAASIGGLIVGIWGPRVVRTTLDQVNRAAAPVPAK